MDDEYLRRNVGAVLTRALAQAAIQQPADPVEYLGSLLLAHVAKEEARAQSKRAQGELAIRDLRAQQTREAETTQAEARERELASRQGKLEGFAAELQQSRATQKSTQACLKHTVAFLSGLAGDAVKAVYVGSFNKAQGGDEDEDDEEGGLALQYTEASEGQDFLLQQAPLRRGQGVTWELLANDAAEAALNEEQAVEKPSDEDLDPEDEEAVAEYEEALAAYNKYEAEKAARFARIATVSVPHVLAGPLSDKVHFHRQPPSLGAFFAARVRYESAASSPALIAEAAEIKMTPPEPEEEEEADADADEEEPEADEEAEDDEHKADEVAEEAPAEPAEPETPKDPETVMLEEAERLLAGAIERGDLPVRHIAICVDTLDRDQHQMVSAEVQEAVVHCASVLQKHFERVDRLEFMRMVNDTVRGKAFVAELPEEFVESMTAAFGEFDEDGNGSISAQELATVLEKLGKTASESELNAMIASVDTDNTGTIELNEFLVMMARRTRSEGEQVKLDHINHETLYTIEEEVIEEADSALQQSFAKMDINHDGFITHEELKITLAHVGCLLDDAQIDQLIANCDLNHDGRISYKEFVLASLRE